MQNTSSRAVVRGPAAGLASRRHRSIIAGPRVEGDPVRRIIPRLWGVPPPPAAGVRLSSSVSPSRLTKTKEVCPPAMTATALWPAALFARFRPLPSIPSRPRCPVPFCLALSYRLRFHPVLISSGSGPAVFCPVPFHSVPFCRVPSFPFAPVPTGLGPVRGSGAAGRCKTAPGRHV